MEGAPKVRRKVLTLALTLVMGSASAFTFLVPLVPVGLTHYWSSTCPQGTAVCSLGGGGVLYKGVATIGYRYLGFGGVWDSRNGSFYIRQNGCHTIGGSHSSLVCYDSCLLAPNGLCLAIPPEGIRSGPMSTFPASWLCSPHLGNSTIIEKGNRTTTNGLIGIEYPNSWNATSKVSLAEVYATIIDSPPFSRLPSRLGWVTVSWWYGDQIHHEIHAWFILTNMTSPAGYVIANYDILNGRMSFDYQSQLICF